MILVLTILLAHCAGTSFFSGGLTPNAVAYLMHLMMISVQFMDCNTIFEGKYGRGGILQEPSTRLHLLVTSAQLHMKGLEIIPSASHHLSGGRT